MLSNEGATLLVRSHDRLKLAGLLVPLLAGGCASAPSDSASASRTASSVSAQAKTEVPVLGRIEADLGGANPLASRGSSDMLGSRLRFSDDRGLLSYSASYSVAAGDVFTSIGSTDARAPSRLAAQRMGQQVNLQLPKLAGAPLSLGMSSEVRGNWTTSGSNRSQREQANLRWDTDLARVRLSWSGPSVGRDPSLALDCELQGTVEVPTSRNGVSQALNLSGRECRVQTSSSRHSGLAAQTMGMSYSWSASERATRLSFSRIEPMWRSEAATPGTRIEPGYELGISHEVSGGQWNASTRLSVRQRSGLDDSRSVPDGSYHPLESQVHWVADTSLTRELTDVAVSARWIHGSDPLWFMPDIGQRRDRFGFKLDMSQWARHLLPEVSPSLAMEWNWSQSLSRDSQAYRRNNELAVNMSVAW